MECNEKDLLLLIALHRITFLTLAEKIILLKKLDSFNALALMSIEDIISTCGRNISKAVWNGKENLRAAQKELAIIQAKKINYVTYLNPEYPACVLSAFPSHSSPSSNVLYFIFILSTPIPCTSD